MPEDRVRFERVSYDRLKARQKELFNFQKLAATLADYGFNCMKLSDDWQGADFLAYHVDHATTLRVQLKARLTIQKQYSGKDIWIAFPHKGLWYLIEHDRLVEKIGTHTGWLNSATWQTMHRYSSRCINKNLLESLAENRLGPVYGPIASDEEIPVAPE